MKLNKKGMTLVELLLSMVFLSAVLIFLFQLLNILQNETKNNNYAYANQINKAEIIRKIQDDLNSYSLKGVNNDQNDSNKLNIRFVYNNCEAILESEKSNNDYYLKYTNCNEEITTWKMKDAIIGNSYFSFNGVDETFYYFKLNIEIYNAKFHEQNNSNLNNFVDDIEISYVVTAKDNLENKYNLTRNISDNRIQVYANNDVQTSSY